MRKILLASADTDIIVSLSRPLLTTGDYQISAVNSGPDVIRVMSQDSFACLILDTELPGLSPVEIIQGVKKSEGSNNIPILIITDSRDRSPASTVREAGASDFLKKPIFSVILLKKINDLTFEKITGESDKRGSLAGTDNNNNQDAEEDILGNIHKSLDKSISFEKDRQAIHRIHGFTVNNDDILNYKDLFAGDIATAIDFLRMANSLMLGARAKVVGFSSMLQRLGSNTIESDYAALKNNKTKNNPVAQALIKNHFRFHSIMTACLAEEISAQTSKGNHDELFTAGLFHDIGKLYFITFYPELFADMLKPKAGDQDSLPIEEKSAFGIDHADLGVLIFRKLGFAKLLQETCLHKNILSEEKSNFQNPSSMKIIHVASALSHILLDGQEDIDFDDEYYDDIKKIIRESRISIKVIAGNSIRRIDFMASRLNSKLTISSQLAERVYDNFNIKTLTAQLKEIQITE
ncbi:MAG: HDOD domain-containing protein [candidate division Zixibacteria bacterium]